MRWRQFRKRNADLERELETDLELEEEEQRDRGLSSKEAHYAARRAFGNPMLIRDQTRAVWSWSKLESVLQDLRFGFCEMRRNAGSTFFATAFLLLSLPFSLSRLPCWRAARLHGSCSQ